MVFNCLMEKHHRNVQSNSGSVHLLYSPGVHWIYSWLKRGSLTVHILYDMCTFSSCCGMFRIKETAEMSMYSTK